MDWMRCSLSRWHDLYRNHECVEVDHRQFQTPRVTVGRRRRHSGDITLACYWFAIWRDQKTPEEINRIDHIDHSLHSKDLYEKGAQVHFDYQATNITSYIPLAQAAVHTGLD